MNHPLWLVPFRPFFILTCLAGLILPLVWVLVYAGAVLPAPTFPVAPLQWHAHEMFYGFGWAGLGGFLLTASKNWIGVRGWHGKPLIFLVSAWLLDRVAMSVGAAWPPALFWTATLLFQVAVTVMLLHILLQQRHEMNGSDNYFFWMLLPLFLVAKWLIVQGDYFQLGLGMSLALFRAIILIVLERTQQQYMRFSFKLEIRRDPALDIPIKWLAFLMVFAGWLPLPVAVAGEVVLALLLLERFFGWHPHRALSRLDIGIMYLAYLMIVLQLALSALGRVVEMPWVGTVSVHVFTLGAMGMALPAMIIRISQGMTGREVVFGALDKCALWCLIGGLAARVILPQLYPAGYVTALYLAATAWLAGFGTLLWRFAPMLLAPRIDGREH